jgi:hypothetical protein
VLPLRLSPLRIIPRQSRDRTTNSPTNTILHALTKVRQLALRLLPLALLVLADALLLEALGADESADGLLQSADVLVPAAGAAVRVVFCDAAGGGGGEGTGLGSCVREVFLGGGFGLAVLALCLRGLEGDGMVRGKSIPCQQCCRSGSPARFGRRQWPGRGTTERWKSGPCWSTWLLLCVWKRCQGSSVLLVLVLL